MTGLVASCQLTSFQKSLFISKSIVLATKSHMFIDVQVSSVLSSIFRFCSGQAMSDILRFPQTGLKMTDPVWSGHLRPTQPMSETKSEKWNFFVNLLNLTEIPGEQIFSCRFR